LSAQIVRRKKKRLLIGYERGGFNQTSNTEPYPVSALLRPNLTVSLIHS
jgi:hypothetical protein